MGPYLGVHIRRNNFVAERPAVTPTVDAAAARLNSILKSTGLEQVFVATDARQSFRDELRQKVKFPLYYFSPDDGAQVPAHSGQETIMLMRILSKAKHFIGTRTSKFTTATIRERRRLKIREDFDELFCDWLGKGNSSVRCSLSCDLIA